MDHFSCALCAEEAQIGDVVNSITKASYTCTTTRNLCLLSPAHGDLRRDPSV